MDKLTASVMAEVEKNMGKKVQSLEEEIKKLKTTVTEYEQRIKTLENGKQLTHLTKAIINNEN